MEAARGQSPAASRPASLVYAGAGNERLSLSLKVEDQGLPPQEALGVPSQPPTYSLISLLSF